MIKWQDPRLLFKVAKLYYEEEKTQSEIADIMRVSRPIISKMLQRAKAEGIVDIKIHAPDETLFQLEDELSRRFGLEEVVLAEGEEHDTDEVVKVRVAKCAADYVLQKLQRGEKISVSWGTTLYQWVEEMSPTKLEGVEVIPIVGGIGQFRFEVHANFIAQRLAAKLGASSYQLYAPAIVERPEIRGTLLSDKSIAGVLDLGEHADWAVVGVGDPYKSTMQRAGYLGEKELEELRNAGAVGDCCSQFVTRDGELCDTELNRRVMAVPLTKLKKGPRVIGICGGQSKAPSLRAVLNGGYLDILISDRMTAEQLLEGET
ncbi:sugar-binding transcriptional regulator [Novibacillus thermophilus]|jgi:deoxyribonucleoside regulator|uniref:Sugar-binding domain-containing protein n=1 Tax=Novibacillus thermophilus TaxID=1471761 RepID=A0A1U9K7Y0_9BACL|nr:sugar-binding transcriptional regulator [Novibacillus thermophilus]AQS56138.1 hypothetical protein B0W44_10545 [Novibacillus thermophilus]